MLMRKCLLAMLMLMLVILMLILMLTNINTHYADADTDLCIKTRPSVEHAYIKIVVKRARLLVQGSNTCVPLWMECCNGNIFGSISCNIIYRVDSLLLFFLSNNNQIMQIFFSTARFS